MLIGCLGLLMAATSLVTEVPPLISAKLSRTNEVRGTFVQTKIVPATPSAPKKSYVMKGTYHLRPGRDFTWKTLTPFETTFYATPTNYVYANEDESVTRDICDLPGFDRFPISSSAIPDFSPFFDAFDALYKEDNGHFFVKARPKVKDLKRALSYVEAEGTVTNWVLTATFPNGTKFEIEFKDE